MNIKESGADTIIKRLRKRFLRKAFDLYKDGVKFVKQNEYNDQRMKYYQNTLNERLLKKVYNAWFLFRRNHQKAKGYWYRVFLRLDLTMKQLAVKKWKESTQKRAEKIL